MFIQKSQASLFINFMHMVFEFDIVNQIENESKKPFIEFGSYCTFVCYY